MTSIVVTRTKLCRECANKAARILNPTTLVDYGLRVQGVLIETTFFCEHSCQPMVLTATNREVVPE